MNDLIARNMQGSVCTIPLYKRLKFAIQAAKGLTWLHMYASFPPSCLFTAVVLLCCTHRITPRALAPNRKNPQIIHRDIKPENIMYDEHMNIKLTDFGLAQKRKDDTLVDLGNALGSPLYMAPELLKWEEFDEKIDIYALAITIWEIVSGKQPPRYNNSKLELIRRVGEEGARPILNFNDPLLVAHPHTNAMLCELLNRMWAQNPHERPTADGCRNGLTEVLFSLIDDEVLRNVWRAAYQNNPDPTDDPLAVSYTTRCHRNTALSHLSHAHTPHTHPYTHTA